MSTITREALLAQRNAEADAAYEAALAPARRPWGSADRVPYPAAGASALAAYDAVVARYHDRLFGEPWS